MRWSGLISQRGQALLVLALALILICPVVQRQTAAPDTERTTPATILASVSTPSLIPDSAVATPTTGIPPTTTTTTIPPWTIGNGGPFAVEPGGVLPTDSECAKRVTKTKENRSGNNAANHTKGNAKAATANNWGSSAAAKQYLKRVSGNYTGTTDEIVQWASCKWGFDPDPVRGQIMVESSWHQTSIGGFVNDTGNCVDAAFRRVMPSTTSTSVVETPITSTTSTTAPNESTTTTTALAPTYQCPTAFGLMQIRSDYQPGTYPMSARSTAFNLDYSLAMKRACYDGVSWLGPQTKGDAWGCVGVHYSGDWLDEPAKSYIAKVQAAVVESAWKSGH